MNTLYYGDNLKILRDYIKDRFVNQAPVLPVRSSSSPPFKGGVAEGRGGCQIVGRVGVCNYSVLFKDKSGTEADSQIHAFEDAWHWHQKSEGAFNSMRLNTVLN